MQYRGPEEEWPVVNIGVSAYCLAQAIRQGEMTLPDTVAWIAEQGGEHAEIVPVGTDLSEQAETVRRIVRQAADSGIPLSHYSVGASFIDKTAPQVEAEIERMKRHIDVACRLGVKSMRHDVAFRPAEQSGLAQFEADLPLLVEAAARLADYAQQFGLTTSIENHGAFVQGSERVLRIAAAVRRNNFRLTVDVGNFLGAAESPFAALRKTLPLACIVHLKDCFLRAPGFAPGQGWREGIDGSYRRATITGHGHLPLPEMVQYMMQEGYEGCISIEFEGMEPCKEATRISLDNVKRMRAAAKQLHDKE